MEFAKAGFHVIGYDVSERVVRAAHARRVAHSGRAERGGRASWSKRTVRGDDRRERDCGSCDAISIAVPTPLSKTRDPDMSYVIAAAEAIARNAHPGMLVVLESTTYPGTTREVMQPKLEAARPHGRQGCLPRVQPRARRSGQPEVAHEEHAEGRRRHHGRVHRSRGRALRVVHRHGRSGVDARKRPSW